MGFCDVAPGQRKILAIRFLHGDRLYRCNSIWLTNMHCCHTVTP